MLNTELYTVASGPCASGDLCVPDPSPAEAEKAIAENLLLVWMSTGFNPNPSGGLLLQDVVDYVPPAVAETPAAKLSGPEQLPER